MPIFSSKPILQITAPALHHWMNSSLLQFLRMPVHMDPKSKYRKLAQIPTNDSDLYLTQNISFCKN